MDRETPYHVLLQALWEGASDAMALSDYEGIVQAANPAYYRLYGYTPDEVIDHSFAIIFPPDMREWAMTQYQAVFHTYTPIPVMRPTIRRKDGTERFVETRRCSSQRTASARGCSRLFAILPSSDSPMPNGNAWPLSLSKPLTLLVWQLRMGIRCTSTVPDRNCWE